MVGIGEDFEDLLKQVRTKEKNMVKNKDFTKIKVIDSFLETRSQIIGVAKDKMLEMQREDFNEAEEKKFDIEEETKFCESLDVIIRSEMERRAKH